MKTLLTSGLLVGLAAVGVAAGAQPKSSDVERQIDDLLARFYRPDGPGAAVIAARDGETVFRRAYGLADIELGVPMRPEMVFQLGSISKQFTAMAVMVLARAGKLSLDDAISTHLSDYSTHVSLRLNPSTPVRDRRTQEGSTLRAESSPNRHASGSAG